MYTENVYKYLEKKEENVGCHSTINRRIKMFVLNNRKEHRVFEGGGGDRYRIECIVVCYIIVLRPAGSRVQ